MGLTTVGTGKGNLMLSNCAPNSNNSSTWFSFFLKYTQIINWVIYWCYMNMIIYNITFFSGKERNIVIWLEKRMRNVKANIVG